MINITFNKSATQFIVDSLISQGLINFDTDGNHLIDNFGKKVHINDFKGYHKKHGIITDNIYDIIELSDRVVKNKK